jgi:threonine synthase
MQVHYHLKCLVCGQTYSPDEVEYVCPKHGNIGTLEVVFDTDHLKAIWTKEDLQHNSELSIWRYKHLLPLRPPYPDFSLRIGWTPISLHKRLASHLGIRAIRIKDDGLLPTGSLKDRASTIAISKAREKGYPIVATASTGNAAAALSGLCANIGQQNVIFVPESAPQAKIAQLLNYGSKVMLVKGTYDDAFELCLAACKHFKWYNRNTGFNPYMTEGKKTVALEICEQLNWQVPDVIFVSVGDGCIIGGVHKGFKDFYAMGWIDRIPRLMGVQSQNSNFLAEAWRNKEDILHKAPIKAHTIADSISAGLPRDPFKSTAAVVETGGAFIEVSDEEILTATASLPRWTGVFAEPAGAAALAGLLKAREQQLVQPSEQIVLINTGNGLKDVAGAMKAVEQEGLRPTYLEPSIEVLEDIRI